MQFENDISLDAEKTLNFKVQLSLSENDLTLQLSDKKKTFVSSVNSARELLAIGTPQNCEGKNNLRLFFNSCKLLFSKASNNQQHLGYFFFSPKNPEDFKTNAKIRSLPALGTVTKHYSQGGSFLYLRFTIYDSISDETFVFYLALYEVNSGTEETALEKNAQILEKRIQKMFDSFSYKINILTQDNEYWKKMYMQAKDEVREIKELIEENAKKTKKPEKALVIPPNALPFVFGILSRMEDSTSDSASFTTELGNWNTSGAENMSALLCGTHSYNNNYVLFRRPPAIEFLQGSTGTFLFKEQHTCLNNNGNYYQYPRALLGAFFIKNNKTSNVSFDLSQGGTSGWSSGYEGASTYLGTPDQNDTRRNSVSSITWSRVFSYTTNNENWTNNTNITVPANTTVCVLVYTTPFFTNGSYNFVMFSGWKVFGLRTALQNAGLELDHELTLKAVQCEGLTDFYKLWHK